MERRQQRQRPFNRRDFAFVAEQFAACNNRSALSGVGGALSHLRVRRFWQDRPLSECNCVVVTACESRQLSRLPHHDWLSLFPAPVVERMQQLRAMDEAIEDAQRSATVSRGRPTSQTRRLWR